MTSESHRHQGRCTLEEKSAVVSIEGPGAERTQLLSGDRYQFEFQRKIVERGRVEKSLWENQPVPEFSLRTAELMLWEVDLEKDTVSVDESRAGIFGHLHDEVQSIASVWRNLIHPNDRLSGFKAWNEHLDGSTERFEAEHRMRNNFGEWKWLLTRGKALERTQKGNR